ncbi:DUF6215 domain-containing protein [Streptomyces xanthochromogenes]|uniref:DUF6215 domain-containing protein n=1 Tax=Streptomyces xanthochromogenes TaxID=67384 RepID=UPI00344031AB
MLGFLLRLLPFWVREPLLIVLGSVLGVRIMYLAFDDHDKVAAGLGLVFLVFTAIRIHTVRVALRARRTLGRQNLTTTPADGTAADPAPHAQAEPAPPPVPSAPEKEPNAWGQAIAAVAVVGALVGAVWASSHLQSDGAGDSTPKAASCPAEKHTELPKAYTETSRAATGDELCKALNRPDLAQLLGTPGEIATSASGTNNTAPLTGEKVAQPEAEVRFKTYTANLSVTYNKMPINRYVKLMEFGNESNIKTLKAFGRPSALYSDHTMAIRIGLGDGGSPRPVEQGPLARTLAVALDPMDRGGYYEVTVWSTFGTLPDDSVLIGMAEKILPTLPERAAR